MNPYIARISHLAVMSANQSRDEIHREFNEHIRTVIDRPDKLRAFFQKLAHLPSDLWSECFKEIFANSNKYVVNRVLAIWADIPWDDALAIWRAWTIPMRMHIAEDAHSSTDWHLFPRGTARICRLISDDIETTEVFLRDAVYESCHHGLTHIIATAPRAFIMPGGIDFEHLNFPIPARFAHRGGTDLMMSWQNARRDIQAALIERHKTDRARNLGTIGAFARIIHASMQARDESTEDPRICVAQDRFLLRYIARLSLDHNVAPP